jgi:hypothetical protein
MRSHEFLDEYSETDQSVINALKKKGYKYLGQGVDQTAFMEPGTGHVLKIFGTGETAQFSQDHKMFFRWYKFCEKNQSNPFLPRFYGHESFFWHPWDDDEKHRYLMIRTEPLKDSGSVGTVLSGMVSDVIDYDSIKTTLRHVQETNPNTYAKLIKQFGVEGITQFLKTARKLEAIGDRAGYAWDLHDGNIMMRANGTPVINDPWVL